MSRNQQWRRPARTPQRTEYEVVSRYGGHIQDATSVRVGKVGCWHLSQWVCTSFCCGDVAWFTRIRYPPSRRGVAGPQSTATQAKARLSPGSRALPVGFVHSTVVHPSELHSISSFFPLPCCCTPSQSKVFRYPFSSFLSLCFFPSLAFYVYFSFFILLHRHRSSSERTGRLFSSLTHPLP